MSLTNPDPELMRIFDFTADDLEANRARQLSERQAKHLKEESDADRHAVGCVVRVAILSAGVLALGYLIRPQKIDLGNSVPQIIMISGLLIWLFLRYLSNQRSNKVTLQTRRAGLIEGNITVHVQKYPERRLPVYQIRIDGKSFRITKTRYAEFVKFTQVRGNYLMFRVYFAPEISQILSIEIVSQ